MVTYKNLSGLSNVSKYELDQNFIIVEFKTIGTDGCNTYKYSYISTGQINIEEMKKLALQGIGLNSFINKYVKKKYESKR